MITIYDSTQWAKIPNRNVNNETKRPWQNVNSLIFSYIFFLWAITIQYIHWLRISKLFVYFFARVNLPIVDIAAKIIKNGILLPKLFWPTVRKKCSSDWEKLLKFEADRWRPRIFKNFEITRTIYSNIKRSEQFFLQNAFFNLSLKVTQI